MIDDDEPVVMAEGGKQVKQKTKVRKKAVKYKAPPPNKFEEKAKDDFVKEREAAKANRTMKGSVQVHHDLFKLQPANFQKNAHLPHQPRWVPMEHCHFFHTRDSRGRKMKYCSSVGGHAHEVAVEVVDGELKAKCGPPIVRVKGDRTAVFPNDNHVHDVEYLWSEEVTARKVSRKAVLEMSDPKFQENVNSVLVNPEYSLGVDDAK